MKYQYIMLIAGCIVAGGCSKSNHDEPEAPRPVRLEEVTSADYHELYRYSADGDIQHYSRDTYDGSLNCTYDFSQPGIIKIQTFYINRDMNPGESQGMYEDVIHLRNGIAEYCEGIWYTSSYGEYYPFKKYRVDIDYTPDGRMVANKWSQWSRNWHDDGWHDLVWEWTNSIYWHGDNIIRFEKTEGKKEPVWIFEYDYTDIDNSMPFLCPNAILNQYVPLQLCGYFGRQSAKLVSETTSFYMRQLNYSTEYEYRFDNGMVSSYAYTHSFPEEGHPSRQYLYRLKWSR